MWNGRMLLVMSWKCCVRKHPVLMFRYHHRVCLDVILREHFDQNILFPDRDELGASQTRSRTAKQLPVTSGHA
jgi:hypothetical protein